MQTQTELLYPTPLHQQVAQIAADYFYALPQIDTLLITNSIARDKATPESDLDAQVLLKEGCDASEAARLEAEWSNYASTHPTLIAFMQMSQFSAIHLNVSEGVFTPVDLDDGGGPDDFELRVGNFVKYAVPFGEAGAHFRHLQSVWLPYYCDALRTRRLGMVREACLHDLDYVPFYVKRELYFQAFYRLYKAFEEFLQALFIAHRMYPIAYNKWIREQVEDRLGMPELYAQLLGIISVSNIASDEMIGKAGRLRELLEDYTSSCSV